MKKILILILFFNLQLSGQIYLELSRDTSLTFDQIVEQTETYFDSRGRGKHTGYKQFKRWEYWTKRSLGPNNKIIPNTEIYKVAKSLDKTSTPIRGTAGTWCDLGPSSATNTSTWSSHIGRITSIGLDDSNTDHYIVGSPSGGIWKTTDNGSTWAPIFDNEALINIYALAISPSNSQIYYAGASGLGIMKSIDGGTTWSLTTGVSSGPTINRIIIDPTNSNIMLATNQWGDIYRSTNAGDNWTIALSTSEQMFDLEFKPGNSNIVYASGDGTVYQSTNNGASFSTISGPWTNNEPMMMAVTPDDPEYLYVLQSDSGGFGGLYLSEDGGSTWSTQADDSAGNNNMMGYNLNNSGGQAPRDMDIIASPTDKTEVHLAGVMTFKSTDSGISWNQTTHWVLSNSLPFVHADVDFMFYQGNKIYCGTDGGLFISTDKANSFVDKTTGLGIRQFYRIGVSKTVVDRVSGGSQDNGTGSLENGAWVDWVGADGMETFIAKHDADIQYASIQYGSLYKTTNGGSSLASISNTPGSGDWVTPLEEDPTDNNVLYQGKAQLYKSTNGGSSWSTISSFNPSNSNDVNLVEVTVAPTNNQVIYAAYRHQIFKTTNGGTTWTDVSPSYNFSNVNYISVHPTNDQKALVVLSGVAQKVVETTDQGATWTDITGSLPSVGAQCAVYEGSTDEGIYVSMNPGIYYKDNNLNPTWSPYMTGIPNVNVAELEVGHNFLYASTYGRGLWKNDLFANLICGISAIADNGIVDCDDNLGTYSRVLEVSYGGPPATGTLDINGNSFAINGSPQTVVLSNQPLDGNVIDVTASFSADPTCSLTTPALYTNPAFCPCIISSANEQILTCEGYSTTTINDDTFTFSIDPQGSHTSSTYSVTGDLSMSNLSYGAPVVFDNGGAGFLSTSGNKNLFITDDIDPTCRINVLIIAPTNCSDNFTCETANTIAAPGTYTAIGPSQGNGGTNAGRNANWYTYVPPSDGLLSVNSCLKGVDTRVFIHDGSCATTLNQVATSDDNCEMSPGGNTYASEIVDLCVTGGTTYYIEWDDRWSTTGFDFEVLFTTNAYYLDADSDGYGDPATLLNACTQPAGYITDGTDCDDTDPNAYPGNTEICDGVDNNCDGMIDEGLGNTTYYLDNDSDGYGDNNISITACILPSGYVTDNTDCDDNDANNFPGNIEVCDGADNNCDGIIDEGLTTTYFLDNDADGYGDSNNSVEDCSAPAGYVANDTDCDDNDANNFPGNTEVCDGADNNCDGVIDEGVTLIYYLDNDGDGYGDSNNSIEDCSAPTGYVADDTDCDDNDANNFPGNTEACDGTDNNCDGIIDEGCTLETCDEVYLVINTLTQEINRAEINLSSDATINNPVAVLFTAGTDIDLTANFEVVLGTQFEAKIQPCQMPPSSGIPLNFDSQNINELILQLNKSEYKDDQLKATLLTTEGEIIFSKEGNINIIKELEEKIKSTEGDNLILSIKFL